MTQRSFEARVRHVRALRDPLALAREALLDNSLFKFVCVELDRCEPDERTARVVIEAHDRGEAPSWLAAALLGRVRHSAGYTKVIEILRRGDRLLSESYAAGAAVQIAGAAAEQDLMDVVDTVEDGMVRKAAAHALDTIGSETAIAFLAGAPARGRLRARTVAEALERAPVQDRTLLDALRAPDLETRRWPAIMLAMRAQAAAGGRHAAALPTAPAVREALAALIEQGEEVVWRADANVLRSWLGTLAELRDVSTTAATEKR